ncbi:MAG: O-antigen ligase family protein [Candidatus Muiribacteriota bacterium]
MLKLNSFEVKYFLVSLFLVLYLTLTNIVSSSGSVILTLLIIISLTELKRTNHLTSYEKRYFILIIAYLLIQILSVFYHGFFLNRFEISLSIIDQELRLLAILPLIFLFKNIKISEYSFFTGAIIGAFFSFLFALFQIIDGKTRTTGSYHAIAFGDIALMLSVISIFSFGYFAKVNKFLIIFSYLGFFAGLFATLSSGTRGAVPALAIFFILYLIKSYKKRSFFFLIIFSITFFFFLSLNFNNSLYPRFSKLYENILLLKENKDIGKFSEQPRFEMWKAALMIIKSNPVLGVGHESFYKMKKELIENGQISPAVKKFSTPHNQFLYDFLSSGIICCILGILIFIYPMFIFFKHIKKNKEISYLGMIFTLSFFVFSLSETIFARSINVTFFVIIIAFLFHLLSDSSCPSEDL